MANAPLILTNVAILFVIAVLWTRRGDGGGGGGAPAAARTWLMVAGLFAIISVIITFVRA